MKERWLMVLLGLVMWAHHLSAAVRYELVNKQPVVGDKVVGVTAQGMRFGAGFNPGPLISWASLNTNSVMQIYNILARENVFIQKSPADKNAIAAAIRDRLNPSPVPAVPADKLPERPALRPLTPQTWRGMPDGFVPLSDTSKKPLSLLRDLLGSTIGIFFCLLILGANLHLSREVADCRKRSRKLVCGLSFFIPFIVPLVFMLLPVPEGKTAPTTARSRVAEAVANAATEQPMPEPEPPETSVFENPEQRSVFSNYYHRDQVKFNRNFFVTELMRFNRAVPIGEWLVIRTNNEREHWAGRIVKAEEEAVTFSVAVGEIWTDQAVRYYQINEIFIQPVDG